MRIVHGRHVAYFKNICNALKVADIHGHFDRGRASGHSFEKRPFPVNFWFGKVVSEKILNQIRLIFPYLPEIQQNKTFYKKTWKIYVEKFIT